MADTKISAMPNATTPLTGAELVPLVQGGVNVKSTIANFGQYARNVYFNHGAWQDTTTQTGSTTVGQPFTFNTTDVADGVTLVSNSQLTVPVAGVYNIQWSGQFQNLDVAPQDAIVWLKINGVDVVGSAGKIGLPARKNPSDPFHSVFGWNYFLSLTAGQYVEIYWVKTSTNITLPAYAASTTPAYPSTASVIVTVNQVG
jgi:hypothetical protein